MEVMPIGQFLDWMEYARQNPFGQERDDYRAAIMPTVFANAFRGKGGKRYSPADFMPSLKRRPRVQTKEQMEYVLRLALKRQERIEGNNGHG